MEMGDLGTGAIIQWLGKVILSPLDKGVTRGSAWLIDLCRVTAGQQQSCCILGRCPALTHWTPVRVWGGRVSFSFHVTCRLSARCFSYEVLGSDDIIPGLNRGNSNECMEELRHTILPGVP